MFRNIIDLVSFMINLWECLVIYSCVVTVLDHILIILEKKSDKMSIVVVLSDLNVPDIEDEAEWRYNFESVWPIRWKSLQLYFAAAGALY